MGNNESPVDQFNADSVVLKDNGAVSFGTLGKLIVSGAKLLLDTGTAWEVVTSS